MTARRHLQEIQNNMSQPRASTSVSGIEETIPKSQKSVKANVACTFFYPIILPIKMVHIDID